MRIPYIISLFVAFIIVYSLVPFVRKVALQWGFVDQPTGRKIHRYPIPLLGGVAIYSGCVVTMILFVGITNVTLTIIIGGLLLVGIGIIDDFYKTKAKEFSVWPRLVLYIIVAMLPTWFGIEMIGITHFFGEGMILLPNGVNWLFTVIWVFALINMMNFIDGVDGLASGIATIAALTLLFVSILKGQVHLSLLAATLAGACLAFTAFNFYPAKIFMGDAGSTFLGFTLAVIAVEGSFKSATVISILVPILALAVPIGDTLFVFSKRLLSGKKLHHADRSHSHHRLMSWGLTQTQTVSFLYLIGLLFSMISIILLLLFR